jgi:hypothetical protein
VPSNSEQNGLSFEYAKVLLERVGTENAHESFLVGLHVAGYLCHPWGSGKGFDTVAARRVSAKGRTNVFDPDRRSYRIVRLCDLSRVTVRLTVLTPE